MDLLFIDISAASLLVGSIRQTGFPHPPQLQVMHILPNKQLAQLTSVNYLQFNSFRITTPSQREILQAFSNFTGRYCTVPLTYIPSVVPFELTDSHVSFVITG